MLTAEQIREKIYAKAEEFNDFYDQKNWVRAKWAYDTASAMAVFMELPSEDMQVLFCVRDAPNGEEIPPLFDMRAVHKAYDECIRQNITHETQPYPGNPANEKDYVAVDPWTRMERQKRKMRRSTSPYQTFEPAPRSR